MKNNMNTDITNFPNSGTLVTSTPPDASGSTPHHGVANGDKLLSADQTKGTVHFVEDGLMPVTTIDMPVDIPKGLKASAMSMVAQDIINFLARPNRIFSGDLSSTDVLNTFTTFSAFEFLRSDPWYSKLKGIYGIRATTVLRFLINGNPYIQGRYMLAAIPRGGMERYSGISDYHTTAHAYTLTQITQLPHVEVDLNRDTVGLLKFPYSGASLFYTLGSTSHLTSSGDPALYKIFPYATLSSVAGSSTVGYEIFLSFEDIELGPPVIPQGDIAPPRGKSSKQLISTRVSNIQGKEAISNGTGPVSGPLKIISKASNLLAKIPILAPVAEPLSWATGVASGVASYFGFSNPVAMGPSQDMTISNMKYLTNADGIDNSRVFGLMSNNEVKITHCSRTKHDEMSLDYVKSIPAYFDEFLWRLSDADGTVLWSFPIILENLNYDVTVGATTLYNYTPVGFLSTMFSLWRGSLTFVFKIVATRFHTGRLSLSFSPGLASLGQPTFTLADSYYIHREIIDLKDGIEFQFTVPYISPYPYARRGESIGTLDIAIINPLNAPATVTNLVKVLIEVYGGDDLEYAVPLSCFAVPVYPLVPQGDITFADSQDMATIRYLGGSGLEIDNMEGSQTCIGERVTSLRQLFKRATQYTTLPATSTRRIMPYSSAYNIMNAVGTISGPGRDQIDLYTLISSCYSMVSGAIRLKLFPSETETAALEAWLGVDGTANYTGPDTGSVPLRFGPYSYVLTSLETSSEVQIPQYLRTYARIVQNNLYNSTAVIGNPISTSRIGVPEFSMTIVNPSTKTLRVYRQAADDGNLQQFVSIPPMYFPS